MSCTPSTISSREVVSGSGRCAQKSEKLAYFEPISEPQFEDKIGILFKKCGIFLIRRLQFPERSQLIPEVVVPTGELSTPDEKNATFFLKDPKISLNSTRFLGSKVALFLRKNLVHNFADFRFFFIVRKYFADFSAKENCHFRPQKTSRI